MKIHINHLTILIHGAPKVVLFAVYFYENFIDIEGVAVASVLSFQSACIDSTEFDAPQADCFAGYSDATFSEQIFNIPMAKIEAIVEPDCDRRLNLAIPLLARARMLGILE